MYSRHQLKVFGYSALVTDIAIQKKIYGSGMTTLVISNKEMDKGYC